MRRNLTTGKITAFNYGATTNLLRLIRSAGGRTTSLEYNARGEPTKHIEPMHPNDHRQHHIDNGDFKRWGGRR